MALRFATGIFASLLLILISVSESIVLTTGLAIVSIICLYEVYGAIGLAKNYMLKAVGYLFSIFIVFINVINIDISLVFTMFLLALVSVYIVYYKTIDLTIIGQMFFVTVYVSFFLAFIAQIRAMEYGVFFIWLTYIGAFITDTFAYLVGISIGKHTLAPEISPKKTVEGCIGGILGCVAGYIVFAVILQVFFSLEVNYLIFIFMGFLAGSAAVLGDLVGSLIKRKCKVKDFSSLFPGHGGFLDRFDSIIIVSPVIYLLLTYFAKFLFV